MQQFDYISFVFNPKKLDTLRDNAKTYICKELTGMVSWAIDEGVYKGQFAITTISLNGENIDKYIGWIPLEDCDNIITT